MARFVKNRKDEHYTPRYLPPQPAVITWGPESKPKILELLASGKSPEEISEATGNRLSLIRTIIYRATHPDEFVNPLARATVQIPCSKCGKMFGVRKDKRAGKKRFCSKSCFYTGRNWRGLGNGTD